MLVMIIGKLRPDVKSRFALGTKLLYLAKDEDRFQSKISLKIRPANRMEDEPAADMLFRQ
jgi:hypothetical protein